MAKWFAGMLILGAAGCGGTAATCDYEGETYEAGESFDAADGCNTCTCDDGSASCTEMGCEEDTDAT